MIKVTIYPYNYEEKLKEYNDEVQELERKRKEFYEKNPDCPYKSMYVNVVSPPKKCIIIEHL